MDEADLSDGGDAVLVQQVQFLAGLEPDGLAGSNADFGAGAGVAPDAGLAGLDVEDAKAAQLDAVVLGERLFHGVEDGVDCGFGLDARKAGAFDHSLNEVLLDQSGSPFFFEQGRTAAGQSFCRAP